MFLYRLWPVYSIPDKRLFIKRHNDVVLRAFERDVKVLMYQGAAELAGVDRPSNRIDYRHNEIRTTSLCRLIRRRSSGTR